MIVQCAQCQARFRIRDEKVTEAGVKVRCSKCQHRFRVRRNGNEAEEVPLNEGQSSELTPPPVGARALNVAEDLGADDIHSEVRTSPGTYLPPEIAQALALAREKGEDEDGVFSAKTVVAPISGAASQLIAKARSKPAPAVLPSAAQAEPAAAMAAAAEASRPKVTGEDSFDPFSMHPGIGAPTPDSGFRPMGIGNRPPAPEPESATSGEFDPFADASPPPPPAPVVAAASPEGDFDFDSNLNLGQQSGVYEMPASVPPLAPGAHETARHDVDQDLGGQDFGSDATGPGDPGADPFALGAPASASVSAPQIDLDASLEDAPVSSPRPALEDALLSESEFNDPFADPEEALSTPGRAPAPQEPESDPFQNLEPESQPVPVLEAADLLPDLPPPEQTQAPLPAPVVRTRSQPSPSNPRVDVPVSDNLWPKDAFGAHRSRATAAVLGVTLLVVAFVALVYRNDGRLLGMFARQSVDTTSSGKLVALDMSNGLYHTPSGRPVFYVRGVVENRGAQAMRAQIRADLLEGSELVSRSEAFAGGALSAEDLYALSATADLEQLLARLEKEAPPISPGARADFVVPFFDYPPDLSSFRLRVTAKEVSAASASVQ